MVVLMLLFSPVSGKQVGTLINQGATVYIGEEGLDITNAMGGSTQIGWWASGSDLSTSASKTINIGTRLTSMTITQSEFKGNTGNWYRTSNGHIVGEPVVAFYVEDPYINVEIWNPTNSDSVNGKSVAQGTNLTFRIDTNMVLDPSSSNRQRSATSGITNSAPVANFTVYGNEIQWGVTDGSSNIPTNWQYIVECIGCGYAPCTYTTPSFISSYHTGDYRVTLTSWNAINGDLSNTSQVRSTIVKTVRVSATGIQVLDAGSATTPEPFNGVSGGSALGPINPTTDGFITLKVKSDGGATYTALVDMSGAAHSTVELFPDGHPYVWPYLWGTGHIVGSQYTYPAGTYYVSAESLLNRMKENYRDGGADYTGKTVSEVRTVVITSDVVKLEADKDSVVRGKPFAITLTGKPSTAYHLWIKGIGTMEGDGVEEGTIPPRILMNQEGVSVGDAYTRDFHYENSGGKTVGTSVPVVSGTNQYFATITTSTLGTRTIEFTTSSATKPQKYTVRVENQHAQYANAQNDEIDINVEKGAVTIVASGDQNYFLGEEIKLSGTNTESSTTYMFLIGPNLPESGASLKSDDPRHWTVKNNESDTFTKADVNGDGSWSYKWGTATVALDGGTYTIYAVNIPKDRDHLEEATYGTVSIVLKKPFVSGSMSSSVVAQGDEIKIVGTAEGDPSSIQIWIMGKNKYLIQTQSVNSDASFTYDIKSATTKDMATGQYFVVVQHPMQNTQFDIDVDRESDYQTWVVNKQLQDSDSSSYTQLFKLGGAGSLQGSDAAQALIEAISDPNVDDTYTKFQFLVENPYIAITPITDKRISDKFNITGVTNLAVDDEILIEVYSSSFTPTQKSQSGEFSGSTGTIKVQKGQDGLNTIEFDVDTSSYKADEYIIKAEAVVQDATGTALFNVLEAGAPIATPAVTAAVTPTATPVVVTQAPTPQPTMVVITAQPTVNATAKQTQSPGYGALLALVGLGAVAFIVVRRE
jgi:PGF-CTERM protein